jgi:Uma2 family endonuclease
MVGSRIHGGNIAQWTERLKRNLCALPCGLPCKQGSLRWGGRNASVPVTDIRAEFGEFVSPQWTRTQLCRLLRDYFRRTRPDTPVRVGTDLPFYYSPSDRLARVVPDLYVMEGVEPDEQLRSYRVWERGRAPQLVVHLVDGAVSAEDGLMMHFLRLGVQDVVLYDPLWFLQTDRNIKGRRLLWHYQRRPSGDGMRLLPQRHPARVPLLAYGLWLCHRGGADLRLYVSGQEEVPPESALWLLPEERSASSRPT